MDILHVAGAIPGALAATGFEQIGEWAFFKLIFEFIDNEIAVLQDNMLTRMAFWIGSVGATLMTFWIIFNGFRILTGQSRDSMMGLVVTTLRSTLIIVAASTLTLGNANIYSLLTSGLQEEVSYFVTGKRSSPADSIDSNLAKMQITMAAIETLPALENQSIKNDIDKAVLMTGIGVAGPAVIGGALLLMYKVALALFVGLGPLFILSLLFEQTKSLFSRWLFYGIGTMFSMAVLSFMVTIAMKIVGAVALQTAMKYTTALALNGMGVPVDMPSVSSLAMQQGGLGLVLTVLLVTIPPMAASFFQGALGQFGATSVFGSVGARGQGGGGEQSGGRTSEAHGSTAPPRNEGSRGGLSDTAEGARRPAQLGGNYGYATAQNAQPPANDRVKKALAVDGEQPVQGPSNRPQRPDSNLS
ncbi:type IV secretion system protein [Lysobacter capsici]|uniref:type IV secretion system protein n=1 Tax=Lysobacter capsici TaxID=435897 RepID=UPI001C004268|nr:type IV secretion system protein [Lysobacter capsici]QWF15275.1 type IV secretion system protein [Lysobacter capsici]